MTPHPAYSLIERIDRALAVAQQSGRTPTAIVIGADDLRELNAEHSAELGAGARFRDLRVRIVEGVFLSRIELATVQGQSNAISL